MAEGCKEGQGRELRGEAESCKGTKARVKQRMGRGVIKASNGFQRCCKT
jgi:hypothetical protein